MSHSKQARAYTAEDLPSHKTQPLNQRTW